MVYRGWAKGGGEGDAGDRHPSQMPGARVELKVFLKVYSCVMPPNLRPVSKGSDFTFSWEFLKTSHTQDNAIFTPDRRHVVISPRSESLSILLTIQPATRFSFCSTERAPGHSLHSLLGMFTNKPEPCVIADLVPPQS